MHIDRYRVRPGDGAVLAHIDPADTSRYRDKDAALEDLDAGLKRLDALQERLYASDRYALLLIFQGMDAAGKDGAITHVLSGVNPQGTEVHAFKEPSQEELAQWSLSDQARKASIRAFGFRSVMLVPVRARGITLGLAIFDKSMLDKYDSTVGQLVLACVCAVYALGIIWLRRLANFEQPERLLGGVGKQTGHDDQNAGGEPRWSPSRGGAT